MNTEWCRISGKAACKFSSETFFSFNIEILNRIELNETVVGSLRKKFVWELFLQ
jgi:hypothetical protein